MFIPYYWTPMLRSHASFGPKRMRQKKVFVVVLITIDESHILATHQSSMTAPTSFHQQTRKSPENAQIVQELHRNWPQFYLSSNESCRTNHNRETLHVIRLWWRGFWLYFRRSQKRCPQKPMPISDSGHYTGPIVSVAICDVLHYRVEVKKKNETTLLEGIYWYFLFPTRLIEVLKGLPRGTSLLKLTEYLS